MTIESLKVVHESLAELVNGQPDWQSAAKLALYADGIDEPVLDQTDGEKIIRQLLRNLLIDGEYIKASALGWGENFEQGPECVSRVFHAMRDHDKLLLMAGSSMGKSYNVIAFLYLDWLLDPYCTAVKLTSRSEDHLRGNVWAHLIDLHQTWLIKPQGSIKLLSTNLYLGMDTGTEAFGFKGIPFTAGAISSGAWKGFKPQPKRPKTDPNYKLFGKMTRLRIIADEAQQYPNAPWEDLYSVMGSMGKGRVKIACCFNPENQGQIAVQKAQPVQGWREEDLDTLYSYEAKSTWWVERMDAAKSENVLARAEIYPGLQTYDNYIGYLKGGGDHSASYYCFARGFPPMEDSPNIIIPAGWIQTQRGEAIYIDKVIHLAAADIAIQGQDKAGLGVGRWGLAAAWRKWSGELVWFTDPFNPGVRQPRYVLTVDQLLRLPKLNDTVQMANEIMGKCKMLDIDPEYVALDSTGNGMGVYSHLKTFWGNVLPIFWNQGATKTPILRDDKVMADELYDGIPSELWFACKRFLDPIVCALLINPVVGDNPFESKISLTSQLSTRRFHFGKKLKTESKDEFKSRSGGQSPDEADIIVQMVHLARMRAGALPGIGLRGSGSNNQESPFGKPVDPSPAGSADAAEPLEVGGDPDPGSGWLEFNQAESEDE